MSVIQGVLPIVHTPFDNDDNIDWPSFHRQIDWAITTGANGCCEGMASEVLRLTTSERLELTRHLVQSVDGRVTTIASVGAESTRQAVEYAQHASAAGVSAVMAIPPMSTALPDAEVLDYFTTIASAINIPMVVQDASSYVGRPIDFSVYTALLDKFGEDRILFKPEAAPLGPNLTRILEATDHRARVFEGSGGISLMDSFRRGISGTMPGMDFLDGIIAIWRFLQAGDIESAYRVYFPVCALVALELQAGLDGFLAIEKYVLHKRGIFTTDRRRRPHSWSLDTETREEVDRLLAILSLALEA